LILQEKLADFYTYLLNKNEENLLSLFSGVPMIDTPFEGKIIGREAFLNFVACQQTWLRKHRTEPEIFALTASEQRICAEFVLYLEYESRNIDLPVGVVADRSEGKVSAIRVYHSTWPFTGKHMIRPPLLKPVENLDEPEVIKRYTTVLRKGDADAVLKLFEDKGYVREPSGSKYKHKGRNGQKEFYIQALEAGGISIKHCTAIVEGTRTAVEYICDGWGNLEFEPQAGMAVYELGATGLLYAARIYDDVTPPNENQ
jgi:hypothetical protein